MVGIVDYGMGNLRSVYHAVEMAGGRPRVCARPEDLREIDRIILPGVGAFRDCMASLHRTGFVEALGEAVFGRGTPLLGICLGMQAMARTSAEGGLHAGLGWVEADVVRLTPDDASLRVPQIGWNELEYRGGFPLFRGLPRSPDFYFVHSYYMKCDDPGPVVAVCDYGGPVTAAVHKGNLVATQFHPEKSQDHGLKLLENYLAWKP